MVPRTPATALRAAAPAFNIATASEWPGGVRKEDVLISPGDARSAWREFMSASTLAVQQVRLRRQPLDWGSRVDGWPYGCLSRDELLRPLATEGICRQSMCQNEQANRTPMNDALFGRFPPQAKITQQANLAAGKRAPPVWAMFAILLLGWNEFVAVVWNPIYLILGFLSFMFGWMLYSELDVDARMQQGWLTGALSIWSNLGDALRTVSLRFGWG
jgi:hypothetical protein